MFGNIDFFNKIDDYSLMNKLKKLKDNVKEYMKYYYLY